MLGPVVLDPRDQYIFRFTDGMEMGLGGLKGWKSEEDHFIFYDDKGTGIVIPKRNLICFLPKPDAAPQMRQEPVEANLSQAPVPQEIKDTVLTQAKTEATRFILREHEGRLYLFDLEKPSQEWLLSSSTDSDKATLFRELATLANEGFKAKTQKSSEDALKGQAALSIFIIDEEPQPCMSLQKKLFDEMLSRGELKSVMCPVVEKASDGTNFRIQIGEEQVRLWKCALKIDSKFEVQKMTRTDDGISARAVKVGM